MTLHQLNDLKKQFAYYQVLGDKTFAQLNKGELLWQPTPQSNSIAIIVNHLHGNMRSRWTNFLTQDGEKEWRNRDAEFTELITNKQDLITKWKEGWQCLFTALNSINESNINSTIYIRNQAHSIPQAINRQLAHYAYHVGQIVYIGRMCKQQQWQSLSIPKGQSISFNAAKWAKGKHAGHFTDDL